MFLQPDHAFVEGPALVEAVGSDVWHDSPDSHEESLGAQGGSPDCQLPYQDIPVPACAVDPSR
jgi:hypothetical protein